MLRKSPAATTATLALYTVPALAQPPPQPLPPPAPAPPAAAEPAEPAPDLPAAAETPPASEKPSAADPASPAAPADAAAADAARAAELQQLRARIAELERKLEALSAQVESAQLEQLIQDAQNEARAAEEEPPPEQREFLAGSLALQKLNPEITFSGDILTQLVIDGDQFYATETDRSGVRIRGVGLHFQHVLDPYSRFKSALHFAPHYGVGIEEMYVSWFGIVPSISLSAGRFRQNFGIVNRWHEHDLDQTSFPTALMHVLGDQGLVGNGFIVQWLMPSLWAHANELVLEVVDGTNEVLFSGEHFSIPSALLHLKNYYDLSPSTYLELGLTGMFGFNNRRGLLTEDAELIDEPWRRTLVGGADLTLYWPPLQQAKYHSLTWRSELYYANKEQPAGSDERSPHAWGLYSYLQNQLSERWFVGVRGDVARPTIRAEEELTWDVVPYITFWQSEFVYLRLEGQHGEQVPYTAPDGTPARREDNRVLLQIDFAAGPHKHEKY